MPGFHGEAATVGCQAGCLICLSREGQVVEATAYDRLPSPAIPTVACWALVRRLSVLTWQEVNYELPNLSLVLREHLRIVAALHVLRLINGWPFQVGPWSLPVALSWVGVAAAAGLCLWAFRLSARA